MWKRKTTQTTTTLAKTLHSLGASRKEIRERIGLSKSTTRSILLGPEELREFLDEDDRLLIQVFWREGKEKGWPGFGLQRLAEVFKMSVSSIHRIINGRKDR